MRDKKARAAHRQASIKRAVRLFTVKFPKGGYALMRQFALAFSRRELRKLGGVRYKPNGDNECARRREQIAKGILRAANGLRRVDGDSL